MIYDLYVLYVTCIVISRSYFSFVHIFIMYFFFFKQKTAYEMRISDWSSDVLFRSACPPVQPPAKTPPGRPGPISKSSLRPPASSAGRDASHRAVGRTGDSAAARSEEHTSELQSLMRISYAVFCLKKKKNKKKNRQ